MKRNKYLTIIQSLAQELMQFKEIIQVSHSQGSISPANHTSVRDGIQNILSLIQEAEKFGCLTLIGEDYLNFCFLLIHGSDMADQLLTLQGNFNVSKKHALLWKKVAKQFKRFLRNNLNDKNIVNNPSTK